MSEGMFFMTSAKRLLSERTRVRQTHLLDDVEWHWSGGVMCRLLASVFSKRASSRNMKILITSMVVTGCAFS